MQYFTFINVFHNTAITLETRDGSLSKRQLHKAWKTLCGQKGCTCGGIAGERGLNPELEPREDGTAQINSNYPI